MSGLGLVTSGEDSAFASNFTSALASKESTLIITAFFWSSFWIGSGEETVSGLAGEETGEGVKTIAGMGGRGFNAGFILVISWRGGAIERGLMAKEPVGALRGTDGLIGEMRNISSGIIDIYPVCTGRGKS